MRLGCTREEKHFPQCVSFHIELVFNTPPEGIITDQLEDTICYVNAVHGIRELCKTREFNLIEHLAGEVSQVIQNTLGPQKAQLSACHVTVTKMAPPVPDIHGGVSFSYGTVPSDS